MIVVLERPSILEFTFSGNKDIKDEDLEKVAHRERPPHGKTFTARRSISSRSR